MNITNKIILILLKRFKPKPCRTWSQSFWTHDKSSTHFKQDFMNDVNGIYNASNTSPNKAIDLQMMIQKTQLKKECNISIGQKISVEIKHAYQPPPTTSLPPFATKNLT